MKNRKARHRIKRVSPVIVLLVVAVVIIALIAGAREGRSVPVTADEPPVFVAPQALSVMSPELIEQRSLTIDWQLQNAVADIVRRYKVGYAAVAVLDAQTGEVLVLYGNDEDGEDCSLALDSYLAASVFKYVTAAAALESGYSPDSRFLYNGKAHTLYRDQLTDRQDRWTREVTLTRAFAMSNNVVFGKLGAFSLGTEPLLLTAMKLGFWRSPLEETICEPSALFLPQDQYNVAELASGFNRQTRISPLHAAQMVTAAVGEGQMVAPRLIRGGEVRRCPVLGPDTARALSGMMAETVRRGTVSSTFRNSRNDRVLKHLAVGAKSGTIGGEDPDGRRNWFVGYARDRRSGRTITLGCLIIREDYYWIEADGLARLIIRKAFQEPVAVARQE